MGTNYYLNNNFCKCCNRSDRAIHLGKSSHGWQFTFRGYRDNYSEDYEHKLTVTNFEEWKELIVDKLQHGFVLVDEYHTPQDFDELLEFIESKQDGKRHTLYADSWFDDDGNYFLATEFS